MMRCLVQLACLSLGLAMPLWSQQQEPEFELPPDLGFLRIVNAAGSGGKLWVTVNGVKLAASSGYEDGFATGAMAIIEKSLNIEMRHDELGELRHALTLKPGIISTLVVYAKRKPDEAGSPEESKAELALHAMDLPASKREEESTLSLLQITPAPQLVVSVKDNVWVLEPVKEQTIPIPSSMGAFLDVKIQNQIAAQLNFTDPAGQGVVLYTDTVGKL